jgi:hypothetical protein
MRGMSSETEGPSWEKGPKKIFIANPAKIGRAQAVGSGFLAWVMSRLSVGRSGSKTICTRASYDEHFILGHGVVDIFGIFGRACSPTF